MFSFFANFMLNGEIQLLDNFSFNLNAGQKVQLKQIAAMYGKLFSFLFSIVFTKYLLINPTHNASDVTTVQNFEGIMNQSREFENEIEDLEKLEQKRSSRSSVPMLNHSTMKVENKNVPLKTPVSVLQELLVKLKKPSANYTCKIDLDKKLFECVVSYDDKSGKFVA